MATLKQSEALINEFKGNLFEFLVGSFVSRANSIEGKFLNNIGQSYMQRLQEYQLALQKLKPELYCQLPDLAKKMAGEITHKVIGKIIDVKLVGKLNRRENLGADLLVITDKMEIPISLKFYKQGMAINTKSAGIKTFIKIYFSQFKQSHYWQKKLNQFVNESYLQMGQELCSLANVEYSPSLANYGNKFSHLPGELPIEHRRIVHQHYGRVIEGVYGILFSFFKRDPQLWFEHFLPLIGVESKKICLAHLFHEDHNFRGTKIVFGEEFKNELAKTDPQFIPSPGKSFFTIILPGVHFYIRVKPMNRFTTPGLKVNCSWRYFDT